MEKIDKALQPLIDYHGLNDITIKNQYPLPLMSTAFEPLQSFHNIPQQHVHSIRLLDIINICSCLLDSPMSRLSSRSSSMMFCRIWLCVCLSGHHSCLFYDSWKASLPPQGLVRTAIPPRISLVCESRGRQVPCYYILLVPLTPGSKCNTFWSQTPCGVLEWFTCHPGFQQIHDLLQQQFWWSTLKDTCNIVKACHQQSTQTSESGSGRSPSALASTTLTAGRVFRTHWTGKATAQKRGLGSIMVHNGPTVELRFPSPIPSSTPLLSRCNCRPLC